MLSMQRQVVLCRVNFLIVIFGIFINSPNLARFSKNNCLLDFCNLNKNLGINIANKFFLSNKKSYIELNLIIAIINNKINIINLVYGFFFLTDAASCLLLILFRIMESSYYAFIMTKQIYGNC